MSSFVTITTFIKNNGNDEDTYKKRALDKRRKLRSYEFLHLTTLRGVRAIDTVDYYICRDYKLAIHVSECYAEHVDLVFAYFIHLMFHQDTNWTVEHPQEEEVIEIDSEDDDFINDGEIEFDEED